MKINLNDYVKVKLTATGSNIYFLKEQTEAPLENGYLRIQLWKLMQIYGSFMWMGNNFMPFETMEVEIERVI